MADVIDFANDLIDNEISRALRKIREAATTQANGSPFCQECGDAIPVERQKLGFNLCVSCASEAERRKALFIEEVV